LSNKETFEGWCILELLGHRKLGGMVREVTIAGAGMLRIDIPGEDGMVATMFYPPSSVYCISPVSEDIAHRYAQHNKPQPVTRYELPALPAPVTATHDDYDPIERYEDEPAEEYDDDGL
jgi:hypothetical protein